MHFVSFIVVISAIPIFCGLALFIGDTAERYGAVIFFVPCALETFLLPVARKHGYAVEQITPYVDLVSTFIISAGFLYLAVRYASLWLAAAMVVQGTEIGRAHV